MAENILALYSCGMSRQDISEQIKNLYNVEISDGLVSKIVEKITPEITAWQNRPPDPVYPFVFMDAIHYKVKAEEAFNAYGYFRARIKLSDVHLYAWAENVRYDYCSASLINFEIIE